MPEAASSRVIIAAYVPVIHRGYWQFFDAHKKAEQCLVFGKTILSQTDYLRKDLRALTPDQQVKAIQGLGIFKTVKRVELDDLTAYDKPGVVVVMPDEDVSRDVAKRMSHAKVEFYPVFLRWDRRSVEASDSDIKENVTTNSQDQKIMTKAVAAAATSSDIWRQVGAVLVDQHGKELASSSNEGEPSVHSPWMEGDPRNVYHQGVSIEASVFSHAEAKLIAEAARDGVRLAGARLYVSTFPCPVCAKLIAHSGIASCYYLNGYGILDGRRVMEAYGVTLLRVKGVNDPAEHPGRAVPYKKPKS